jgi:hypothetical protein
LHIIENKYFFINRPLPGNVQGANRTITLSVPINR